VICFFFDSRLFHRSSLIAEENINIIKHGIYSSIEGVPNQYEKYVLYWNACNKKMVDDFIISSRKRTTEENYKTELFFTDYLKNKYPEDYPAEFVKMAMNNKVEIASLDKFHSGLFKKLYNEYYAKNEKNWIYKNN